MFTIWMITITEHDIIETVRIGTVSNVMTEYGDFNTKRNLIIEFGLHLQFFDPISTIRIFLPYIRNEDLMF